jgi:hypothetical protein
MGRKWLESFIPHRLEMLQSPPWRQVPKPLGRIIERIEIEHLRHGGKNNGELFVSYGQLVDAGVSRKSVLPALRLGEALGLIEVIRPEDARRDIRSPNGYRLTYVPAKGKKLPTDEWKSVSKERVAILVDEFRRLDKACAEKQVPSSLSTTATVPFPTKKSAATVPFPAVTPVVEREQPSISRVSRELEGGDESPIDVRAPQSQARQSGGLVGLGDAVASLAVFKKSGGAERKNRRAAK